VTFIDTNVLILAAAGGVPLFDRSRAALTQAAADGLVTISRQVLREYLSVMTRQPM
jgi:predicted nucleic acid-binding protein